MYVTKTGNTRKINEGLRIDRGSSGTDRSPSATRLRLQMLTDAEGLNLP